MKGCPWSRVFHSAPSIFLGARAFGETVMAAGSGSRDCAFPGKGQLMAGEGFVEE